MDNPIQGQDTNPSAIVPVKRKRGRPRKYPRLDFDHGGIAHVLEQNLNYHTPSGLGEAKRNQPGHIARSSGADDVMVGQVVRGVIDAAFDAGYLITVRVGHSKTTLKGVVFKVGHYIPVSADNDVAPGVQMIQRNEISLPRESYSGNNNSQSGEKIGTGHTTKASSFSAPESKQVPSLATPFASAGIPRRNPVPMVFQPVNLSTGLAVNPPSNGLPLVNQGPIFNNRVPMHMREMNSGSTAKPPTKVASVSDVDDDSDSDQALSAEPLQAVQPTFPIHPSVISQPMENYRTGKMTELLQVLQESLIENQKNHAAEMAASSRCRPDEIGGDETDHEDEDGRHKQEHSQTSI